MKEGLSYLLCGCLSELCAIHPFQPRASEYHRQHVSMPDRRWRRYTRQGYTESLLIAGSGFLGRCQRMSLSACPPRLQNLCWGKTALLVAVLSAAAYSPPAQQLHWMSLDSCWRHVEPAPGKCCSCRCYLAAKSNSYASRRRLGRSAV